MSNKQDAIDRATLSLKLASNLESFNDDDQLKCLKLFTMVSECFIKDADIGGVLLIRANNVLTVAGLNIVELEAEELIYAAANAFADSDEHRGKGDTH